MAKLSLLQRQKEKTTFNLKEVDIPSEVGGLGFNVIHASWNGSASFNWATDRIASSGVSNVTREKKGVYQSNLSADNFASSNYTVTTGVGSEDYSGINASPRCLSVLLEITDCIYCRCHL